MSRRDFVRYGAGLLLAMSVLANAFAQMPNPYGAAISLENAKRVAAPALAEAAKNNWSMAVAIVDPSGNLVYYEKMDNTQLGSATVAIGVSGGTAPQDGQCAKAGADALK